MTVIDFVDNRHFIKDAIKKGVVFELKKITKSNLSSYLKKKVGKGDMIIDVAWNIDACEILEWCHKNGVLYINTSVEVWDPYENAAQKTPQERTLYHRHMAIRKMMAKWKTPGATAIVEHGANPGLVSHFTKWALRDIANKIVKEKPRDPRSKILPQLIKENNFPKIAQLTGTKVIHISERDYQITDQPKKANEFVNTWSIEGFYEEGIAPAEMGWGTHEKQLPKNAFTHKSGPKNQICLAQPGIKTKVRSFIPSGEIRGMVIRHGEAFTISDYLTVKEKNKAVYRPTVHYAYYCCNAGILSLHELEMRNYKLQKDQRIMTDEIIDGRDELGVLLLGHDFKAWWCGSLLDIHESRKLVPEQNATTLQVACSALSAIIWMIKNPEKGICIPDELPYEEILRDCFPYLGPFVSKEFDWDPLKNRVDFFERFNKKTPKKKLSGDDLWQFENFLLN